jgi:ABC-2 type transport system ATP-binding protein
MKTVVEFENVFATRGHGRQAVSALRGINLSIRPGSCVCLLGPNGAGKSSAVRLILGLAKPSGGTVRVAGRNPCDVETRKWIGCTPQDSEFLPNTTVAEVLAFVAAHYENPSKVDDVVTRFRLNDIYQRQTRTLSGGQLRLLSLACSFIGNPKVIILDEPTTGLDPEIRRHLWAQIRDFTRSGGAVLLTTHYLDEAEELSDYIYVIDQGVIKTSGTVGDIRERIGYQQIHFDIDTSEGFELPENLAKLCEVKVHAPADLSNHTLQREPHLVANQGALTHLRRRYTLTTRKSDELVRHVALKTEASNLRVEELSLEEVMLKMWKGPRDEHV